MSVDGGTEPVWSPTGRELYYRAPGYLMSARLADGPRLDVSRRDTLLRDVYLRNLGSANYDVFPDGREFVMLGGSASGPDELPLIVMLNWKAARRAADSRER